MVFPKAHGERKTECRIVSQMKTIRTTLFWSAVRNWGTRLGSVVVFTVVARVLPPEQLGLFAAAATIIAVADLFAENGLGDAIVQYPEISDRLLSAALICNTIIAVVVSISIVMAGPPLEEIFNVQGLSDVLNVVILTILLNAFGYIPQAYLRRSFRFQWLAFRALVTTIISGGVGIIMALFGFGVWSLVAQALLASALNLIIVWVACPWRLRCAPPSAVRPLLRVSVPVFVARFGDFVSSRGIELAIVVGLGPVALALWIMASRPWGVLMQLTTTVTMDVALPSFARLANDREALLRAYYSSLEASAAIGTPIFILLAAVAPETMLVMFGENGRGGGYVLMVLSLVGAIQVLQYYNGTMLNALGKARKPLLISAVKAAAIAIALMVTVGQPLWNVGLAYAIGQASIAPLSFAIARAEVGYSLRKIALIVTPFILAALIAFAAVALLRPLLWQVQSAFLKLMALGVAGSVSYTAVAFLLNRRATLRVLSHVIRGRTPAASAADLTVLTTG